MELILAVITGVTTFIGSARLVAKPAMTFIIKKVKETGTKDDDKFVAKYIIKFTEHKLGAVIAYIVFDLCLSINLKSLAKELKP